MFKQPEVCVISDLHFGIHQNSNIWHQTSIQFVKWLSKKLKTHGINDIIIAGDIFHNRNEIAVNTINVVADIFNILADFNITILVGNHDAFYKDRADINSISILNGWKNIKIYTTPTIVEYMDEKIAFCPWGTTIEQIPIADIIFGHFEISSFKMNNFKICEEGFKIDNLFTKSNLIISGHFHIREERIYKNGTVIYLGSPYELDWGDKDTIKGIYLLDILTKKYTFIENKESPKHIEIKLSNLIQTVIDSNNLLIIKNNIKGNIVRFTIDKEIEQDKLDILINKLNSYGPIIFSVDYTIEQNNQPIELQQIEPNIDISQTFYDFIQTMDIKQKDKTYNYTLELYNKAKNE